MIPKSMSLTPIGDGHRFSEKIMLHQQSHASDRNDMTHPVFRFAPSPNGHLHLGHALSALLNADIACATGGGLALRIEDIDATRCRPEYESAILEDLAWLGITWEEPVRRQSEHFDA